MSAPLSTPTAAAPITPTARVASIDLIRGAVMVLMAIDHVRVYSGLPADGPTAGIFFTRWVTHFVAPAFIFLAGTSAFFYGRKHTDLSRFLFVRGVWLVLLELTVIRVCWTFNLDFANYMLAGVIWVIGWCMILMSALVRLRPRTAGIIGIAIIALHNLVMMPLINRTQALGELWKILYIGFFQGPVAGTPLIVLYSIIPWIGVMAAGYWFGTVLTLEPARRNRICLRLGLGATALFLVLRGFNVYGDPQPWSSSGRMPALLSFLNTSKYPASLSFLLMTLGHALALIVSKIRTGSVDAWLFTNHPMANPPAPEGYTWSLGLLYLVWAIAIVLLYFPSRWYADLKARRTDWWLKYL